jgi:2-keto-4-pentenoate hydratase/2-oxohepta-3-ene-1,7-dioic acid hydratase in catechol pathway
MSGAIRIESRRLRDGAYASTLFAGDRSCDVGAAIVTLGVTGFDPRRETPLDALLQSERFHDLLPRLVASARPDAAVRDGAPSAPVVRPGKIVALGRTYREHAAELGNVAPPEPLVFAKLVDGLVATGETVRVPGRAGGRMDHEAELAVLVGRQAAALPNGNARDVIAGLAIANDLTLRAVQKAAQRAGHPWLLAKNFPGACVLGPWMTVLGPGIDPDGLGITCSINGSVRQSATTAALVHPVAALVEWLSHVLPLDAGDVVLTGTPAGTGPLLPGDVCEIAIAGDSVDLGSIVTTIG